MKRSTLRASKEHKTVAQYRIAWVVQNGVPLSLLKDYLEKFYHWPRELIENYVQGMEAPFEHLEILSRIDRDSQAAADNKAIVTYCMEMKAKIANEQTRVKKHIKRFAPNYMYNTSEPNPLEMGQYIHSRTELQNYSDKHGV